MTGVPTTFEQLRSELEATRDLVEGSTLVSPPHGLPMAPDALAASDSLLDVCERALALTSVPSEEPCRIIFHLACTGGTLLSKLIAALPNTFLLSELHPQSPLAPAARRFAPSDLGLLSRAALFPDGDAFCESLFANGLRHASDWVSRRGGNLVLRDHSHSDFCWGAPKRESTLLRICAERKWPVRPLVTVRHPAASFASLERNGWVHFEPADFITYCDRYIDFLEAVQSPLVMRYEDFLASPEQSLIELCDYWSLPYCDTAVDTFSVFAFSGDSGRSGAEIAARAPSDRELELRAATNNASYRQLLERLGYPD